jgi:hypothetical protein
MKLELNSASPAPSVFDQLATKNQELTVTITSFRAACAELAAKNGQGEPIRQRIRQALFLVRGTLRGSSR